MLTGFSEFEYARTAVQIGVSEYLLKPFTEEELMQCLCKMKQKIIERRELSRQSRQNSLFAISQFLRELADGECAHPETAQKILQEYEVTFEIEKSSVAVLLQMEDTLKYWVDFQDRHTAKFCVSNILSEVIGTNYHHAVFNAGASHLGILINVEKTGLSGLQMELEEICRLCRRLLKCGVTFSISETGSGIAQMSGLAAVSDSLTALRTLCFENEDCGEDFGRESAGKAGGEIFGRFSKERILEGLRTNFEDDVILRAALLNRAPKYGNDDDRADQTMVWLCAQMCRIISSCPHPSGSCLRPGLFSFLNFMDCGQDCGALPNGRRAGEPFVNGISPSHGMDKNGPTAFLKSAGKLDYSLSNNASTLDIRRLIVCSMQRISSSII